MILCHRCGAEGVDVHVPIAAPAKKLSDLKKRTPPSWHWSQVSQRVCPTCGAIHVNIRCDRNK